MCLLEESTREVKQGHRWVREVHRRMRKKCGEEFGGKRLRLTARRLKGERLRLTGLKHKQHEWVRTCGEQGMTVFGGRATKAMWLMMIGSRIET